MRAILAFAFTVSFFIYNPTKLNGQKSRKVNKNHFAVELSTGFSFSDYDSNQNYWEPKLSPLFTLNLLGNHRINNRLDLDFGVGGAFYYLIHRAPTDKYVLDFAAPHLVAGIGYNFFQTSHQELFIKLLGIIQVGYNGTFRDEFEQYTVDVSSLAKYHYALDFRTGWKIYSERKSKQNSQININEIGMHARFTFKDLGDVVFDGDTYRETITPTGDIAGVYYRLYFTVGSKKVKRKTRTSKVEKPLPPIIYNPRY